VLFALLTNFAITLAVELGFSLLITYKQRLRLLIVITGANMLTNPLAQLAYNQWFVNLWLIELVVILTEAIIFRLFLYHRLSNALIMSFMLNSASILVGLLLYGVLLS
jgi:hypothetical protein